MITFLLQKNQILLLQNHEIDGSEDIRRLWDTPYNILHIMHEDVLMNFNRVVYIDRSYEF